MLQRAFRLRRTSDFNKVYKFGKKASSQNFYVKARQTHLPTSRLAIVVTKKVSKKATLRNRIKRQASEIVRLNWQLIRPGFDIIVMITKDISAQPQDKIKTEILASLKQLNLIEQSKS